MTEAAPHIADLKQLVALFHDNPNQLGAFVETQVSDVVAPFDRLLVHEHHMTVTVESFHNSPVSVDVIQSRTDGPIYSREILLKRQSDDAVVQYGIVQLDLSKLSEDARQRIESCEVPLGRVLIENDVMRQVELIAVWKITPSSYLATLLGIDSDEPIFGRSAMIHVNDEPVIRLLEIVTPAK